MKQKQKSILERGLSFEVIKKKYKTVGELELEYKRLGIKKKTKVSDFQI